MAREIRSCVRPLSLLAVLALLAVAHSAASAGEQTLSGTYGDQLLAASEKQSAPVQTHRMSVIQLGAGEGISGPSLPANREQEQTGQSAGGTSAIAIAVAAILPVAVIGIGALMYFRFIVPRRQMRPYREALGLVQEQKYGEALPKITAMEGKLPDKLRRDARFFVAFCHHQLQELQEAEHVLAALHRENPKSAEPAYLLAWLRIQGRRYDEAEPVLEKMESNGQLGFQHARKLLGIVKFHRAITASKEGNVDGAADLFEKVETLGDFAGSIPTDLRNRHVVLGTQALFDKDIVGARKQFESLQEAAGQLPDEQRELLLASAKLGLALASWAEDQADFHVSVEDLLVEAAKLLDPDGPLDLPWPDGAAAKSIVERLEELDEIRDQPAEKQDIKRWLRDMHFVRGMAVLRSWSRMDKDAAHDAIAETLEAALVRFAVARALDEDFSDVLLVVGLLKYYVHKPGSERSEGLDLLQAAQKLGMRDPDATEIINNRERIEKANADAVDKYLQMLDKYLLDDTVRSEVRVALMERMARFEKIRSWDSRPDLAGARSVEPTVAEMRNRSEILLARIDEILAAAGRSDDADKLRETVRLLQQDSERLSQQARAIEEMEAELLAVTGNELLRDR
jgi:hypothetical protein